MLPALLLRYMLMMPPLQRADYAAHIFATRDACLCAMLLMFIIIFHFRQPPMPPLFAIMLSAYT